MFRYIPKSFAAETAADADEANRWLQGDKSARRPPELLTRDVVARAINREVKDGRGSPHGGVFLDIASRRPADFIRRKLPSMYHQFKELAGLDITKAPMEVGPTLHYFMGGIRVDADSQQSTTVPGLFACGECAAGLHGANRLGGNSLSDLLVFGRLAGIGAADYIKQLKKPGAIDQTQVAAIMSRATDILNRTEGSNPYLVHEELQEIMQAKVGIIRTAQELKEAIEQLAHLGKKVANLKAHGTSQYNAGWHEAIDLANLMVTAEAAARAALLREESRGAHTREDFEGERDEWGACNILIRRKPDGTMAVEKFARPNPPEHLAKMARASIEELEESLRTQQYGE
jgi:succinate dehydrogenase / fumarate reductase flavoprotein subunit